MRFAPQIGSPVPPVRAERSAPTPIRLSRLGVNTAGADPRSRLREPAPGTIRPEVPHGARGPCPGLDRLLHPAQPPDPSPVARRLQGWLGTRAGAYRFCFNMFSLVALLPLVFWHLRLRGPWIVEWAGLWLAVPVAPRTSRPWCWSSSVPQPTGRAIFWAWPAFGRPWAGKPAPADESFATRGILRWVRHPWYTGSFLLLWGHDLDAAGLAASLVLTAYLFVGTWLEERKLVSQFGDTYREYQRRVPMFVPRRPGSEKVRSEE